MESWRLVWRLGMQPSLPTAGLRRLLQFLRNDDKRWVQGATTSPPPLMVVRDWPIEAGDAIAIAAVDDFDCTVGEAEEAFARVCFECDQRLGEPAACRWQLNWHDDSPRDEVRRELIAEVELELARRDLTGRVPSEFAAAFFASPTDSTLAAAVADYLTEHDDSESAALWRHYQRELETAK